MKKVLSIFLAVVILISGVVFASARVMTNFSSTRTDSLRFLLLPTFSPASRSAKHSRLI